MDTSTRWKKNAELYRLGHPDVCRWVKFYRPEGGDSLTLWSRAHGSQPGVWERFRIAYEDIEAIQVESYSILELVLKRGGAVISGWHMNVLASLIEARLVRSVRPRSDGEVPLEPIGPFDGFATEMHDYRYPSCLDPTDVYFDKKERFSTSDEKVPTNTLLC